MIDTFLKVIEKLTALAKARQERSRNLFGDLVEPLMHDFEEVHDRYIEDLQEYRELIDNKNEMLSLRHQLFPRIESDVNREFAGRRKLALVQLTGHPDVDALIEASKNYIFTSMHPIDRNSELGIVVGRVQDCTNIIRTDLDVGLEYIILSETTEDEQRRKVRALITNIVAELNARYENVRECYERCRFSLLAT